MLVTGAYVPDKDAYSRRSHLTNEVAGDGYAAIGAVAAVSVGIDAANDHIEITLGGVSWPSSSISARGLAYYKSRGWPSADELVAFIDFGEDVASANGTFAVTASTLRIQN